MPFMKTKILLLAAVFVSMQMKPFAQFNKTLSSANLEAYKTAATIDNIDNTIDNIDNTAKKAQKIGKILKGFIGKKKNNPDKFLTDSAKVVQPPVQPQPSLNNASTVPGTMSTIVSIKGIEYTKLRNLEENIKACAGVQATAKKFNSASSTIEVMHTGSTDALLTLMLQTSEDIFTAANIETSEEGKIMLKL